ncbi:occludin [Bacteroides sp. 51]|uniref:occludin n=1 Tax=Bacteroides sp. 51 TaxID=2302938 RepID=UPI0013D444A6|nr:occludin [Bacteroides sp. 51]NDV82897.1 occludin [Bacteroides sp. 51]
MRKLIFILTLLAGTFRLSAQNEVTTDSIQTPPAYNIKPFGDFMLDMTLFTAPKIPSFSTNLLGPDATKDYSLLFMLPLQMVLSKTHVYNSYSSFGIGVFPTSNYLQSATFQLNDNMRLSTYGQYTLDGKRIPNPSALPWEKNNFMGGMELKFNKNFGIRIEVQQGRNPMYPY